MRWIAGAGNHGCWLGSYESNKQRELPARIKPGHVVYDLGANAGYFTLMGSVLTGPHGRVISFEPLPANLVFLQRHLELNRIQNCTVVDAAVAAHEGTAHFTSTGDRSMTHLADGGDITVRVVTLDGMLERGEIPPADVIKCDVEGAELDVLRGADAVLRKHHPLIFLDTHSAEAQSECRKLLGDLGYELTTLDGLPLEESGELLAVWREGK